MKKWILGSFTFLSIVISTECIFYGGGESVTNEIMGRGKHITQEQRAQVSVLRRQGMSTRQVAKAMGISQKAVFNALAFLKLNGTCKKAVPRTRKRKSSERLDRLICRASESDRKKTAVDIHKEFSSNPEYNLSVRTVRRRLNEVGLMGRVSRKKSLVSKKNRIARIAFAKEHNPVFLRHKGLLARYSSHEPNFIQTPPYCPHVQIVLWIGTKFLMNIDCCLLSVGF